MMNPDWIKKIVGFVALGIGGVVLIAYLFMLLWNMLIPDLFNGPLLNFAQALGLLVLAKILFGFGSLGNRGRWGGTSHHHHHEKRSAWKHKLEEKMANMSDEEKEKLKYSMKGWCYGKKEKPEKSSSSEE